VELDAEVAMIERRQQIAGPRVVHDKGAIVAKEVHL
jgi:hypothetical protein